MEREDEKYEFRILGGAIYSEQNRPSHWFNAEPLFLSKNTVFSRNHFSTQLPIQTFPLIEDFEVFLERLEVLPEDANGEREYHFGYHICFFSASHGYVVTFPWWYDAERDLQQDDFTIPLGDSDHPFYNFEQGWEVIIAKHDRFIYILEGDFDKNHENREKNSYYSWFKVTEERYMAQWYKAIQTCRQMESGN